MKKKNKKYCKNEKDDNNILYSCGLYGDITNYYKSTGETGETQYGSGAKDNYLNNAVQAEETVPVQQIKKVDNTNNKNKHKN